MNLVLLALMATTLAWVGVVVWHDWERRRLPTDDRLSALRRAYERNHDGPTP